MPVLLFVHFVSLRKVKRKAMMFANYEAMEKVFGSKILSKNYPLLFVRILTLVLLILSITGIIVVYEAHVSDYDYALAIDASASMLAQDYQPSRLDAAKSAAQTFVGLVPEGTRMGVLSFAGTGFVEQELTGDKDAVRDAISSVDISVEGGTAMGEAIVSSTDALLPSDRGKSIILITDGESNIGISVEDAVEYARKFQVRINTIGIGSEEGGLVVNTSFYVGLDAETLERVANETGGRYFRARTKRELENAYMSIATGSEQEVRTDISTYVLLMAMASLLTELVLVNTRYRTIP